MRSQNGASVRGHRNYAHSNIAITSFGHAVKFFSAHLQSFTALITARAFLAVILVRYSLQYEYQAINGESLRLINSKVLKTLFILLLYFCYLSPGTWPFALLPVCLPMIMYARTTLATVAAPPQSTRRNGRGSHYYRVLRFTPAAASASCSSVRLLRRLVMRKHGHNS